VGLLEVARLSSEREYDLVVVDTAPTGHTLRMLGAGDHFRQFAEALDAMEAKHRGMVRQFMRKNVRDAIDDYIDKFDDDAKRRRALMTTFVPVFLSEPWVVEQTLRLIEEHDTRDAWLYASAWNRRRASRDERGAWPGMCACAGCASMGANARTSAAAAAGLRGVKADGH